MTAYNAEATVDEAIGSIVAQSYQDWSCIVVDDGSTDSTMDRLAHWARQDRRIKIVQTPNQGQTIALNTALARADGELIARMDADDVSDVQRFSHQVEWMASQADLVALGSLRTVIDQQGVAIKTQKPKPPIQADLKAVPPRYLSLIHPSAMIRREALDAVNGYRPFFRYAQDVDLWLRLAQNGRLAVMPESLLRYRSSDTAVSSKYVLEQQLFAIIAILCAVARSMHKSDPLAEQGGLRLKPYLDHLGYGSHRKNLEAWVYQRLARRAGNQGWPAWLVEDAQAAMSVGIRDASAPKRLVSKLAFKKWFDPNKPASSNMLGDHRA